MVVWTLSISRAARQKRYSRVPAGLWRTQADGEVETSALPWFQEDEHFKSDLRRVTFWRFHPSSSPTPPSLEVIPVAQFSTDFLTWLLRDTFKACHPFFPHLLIPKIKRLEKPLSAYRPPRSNLLKSFLALALNIISRILQPPVLFPPLFSIFNSAPEWGLCEARHACQREI